MREAPADPWVSGLRWSLTRELGDRVAGEGRTKKELPRPILALQRRRLRRAIREDLPSSCIPSGRKRRIPLPLQSSSKQAKPSSKRQSMQSPRLQNPLQPLLLRLLRPLLRSLRLLRPRQFLRRLPSWPLTEECFAQPRGFRLPRHRALLRREPPCLEDTCRRPREPCRRRRDLRA